LGLSEEEGFGWVLREEGHGGDGSHPVSDDEVMQATQDLSSPSIDRYLFEGSSPYILAGYGQTSSIHLSIGPITYSSYSLPPALPRLSRDNLNEW